MIQLFKSHYSIYSKFTVTLTNLVPYYFAKLAKTTEIKDSTQPKNLQAFYEDILKYSPTNERGKMKFSPGFLTKMIRESKTSDDIELTVNAFYNFLGHGTTFKNSTLDNLVKKSLELDCVEKSFDIIKNHNYLFYYPHHSVIEEILIYKLSIKKGVGHSLKSDTNLKIIDLVLNDYIQNKKLKKNKKEQISFLIFDLEKEEHILRYSIQNLLVHKEKKLFEAFYGIDLLMSKMLKNKEEKIDFKFSNPTLIETFFDALFARVENLGKTKYLEKLINFFTEFQENLSSFLPQEKLTILKEKISSFKEILSKKKLKKLELETNTQKNQEKKQKHEEKLKLSSLRTQKKNYISPEKRKELKLKKKIAPKLSSEEKKKQQLEKLMQTEIPKPPKEKFMPYKIKSIPKSKKVHKAIRSMVRKAAVTAGAQQFVNKSWFRSHAALHKNLNILRTLTRKKREHFVKEYELDGVHYAKLQEKKLRLQQKKK